MVGGVWGGGRGRDVRSGTFWVFFFFFGEGGFFCCCRGGYDVVEERLPRRTSPDALSTSAGNDLSGEKCFQTLV